VPDSQPEKSDSENDNKSEENAGKSLLEEIWEQKHPEQVKKMKEDAE